MINPVLFYFLSRYPLASLTFLIQFEVWRYHKKTVHVFMCVCVYVRERVCVCV